MTEQDRDDTPAAGGANDDPAAIPERSGAGFPVVALGGSAGSLEALQGFFGALPADTGCAFVVITHQPPDHHSLLPEILGKETAMPVVTAVGGAALAPDHVYVAVPDGSLSIDGGVFVVGDQPGSPNTGEATSARHHPIDTFFRALAEDQHDRAVAVVLSGSGTDGAVGLKDIKAESGMVLVQQPDTADFDSMPASALATGLVDHSLPVDRLPERIGHRTHDTAASAGLSEHVKDEVVALLREHTGNDLSGYKRNTLYRRIQRRMDIRHMERGADYLQCLRDQPDELDHLFRETMVTVTRFFRDPDAWEILHGCLRQYIERLPADHEFRAWVAGCASGEEAYTLAMLASECMEALERPLPVQIFATDIEPGVLQTGRAGRYPAGIANDVPSRLLHKYFHYADEHYVASKSLRDRVLFTVHNAAQNPPFIHIDVIACRNLLIYLDDPLQSRLQSIFEYALRPGGLLFLGSAETIDDDRYDSAFDTVDRRWKLFRRTHRKTPREALPPMPQRTAARRRGAPSRDDRSGDERPVDDRKRDGDRREGDLSRDVERMLVARYAPPSVIVRENGDAAYFHGHTGKLLAPSAGVPGNNILDMAREGLRATLREALRAAAALASPVREASNPASPEIIRRRARVRTNGGWERYTVTVSRTEGPESVRGLLLVSFTPEPVADGSEESPEAAPGENGDAEPGTDADRDRIAQLERELEAVTAERSGTREQLESSNEDLQAANEELQSANEELQSSNEELETSREETESLNEELTSVNAEIQEKVRQLERANNDMSNMLNSTDLAILFLGRDLEVRRFTDRVSSLISVRQSDVGRPVSDLATHLRYDGLIDDASQVLQTLQYRQAEVQAKDGHWYLMRVMPYRTLEHEIDGVVCTFIDIDDVKRAESREAYFRSIVETVREPLVVLDEDLRIVSATENFHATFALKPRQTVGHGLFEFAGGQFDDPDLRRLFEEVLPRDQAIKDFELDADFPRIGRKRLLLNARRLERAMGEPAMILLALEERGGEAHTSGHDGAV